MAPIFALKAEHNRTAVFRRLIGITTGWFAPAKVRLPGCNWFQTGDRFSHAAGMTKFICRIAFSMFKRWLASSAQSVQTVANTRADNWSGTIRPDNVWGTSWARRANLIAFTTGPQFASDEAIVDLWTAPSDGTKPAKNLTTGKFRNNAFPDLTADGKEMVFRSTRDGNKEIYLMNSDGTNVRRITNDPADDTMPSVSPNGDIIAFSSDRAGGLFHIYLQPIKNGKPDGALRQFTHGFAPNMHSRFSPDGKWLVYASARGWLNDEYALSNNNPQPYGELFVAPIDGSSEPIRLTHNKWEDSIPSWGTAK